MFINNWTGIWSNASSAVFAWARQHRGLSANYRSSRVPTTGPIPPLLFSYTITLYTNIMRLLLGRWIALVASTCLASGAQEPLLLSTAGKQLILKDDLIAFHKNLTQIESISGNEKEVGEWLLASLESQGYHVEKQEVQKKPERFNVLAWPGEKRDAKVVLSSHIDTVSREWQHDPNIRLRYPCKGPSLSPV